MATRSRIAIEHEDGVIESIYSHWDGYPSHNGKILVEHYADRAKVKELIALGDISILAERVAPNADEEHSFENRIKDVTLSYHRDREETYNKPRKNFSRAGYANSDVGDYGYLFTNENEWLVVSGNGNEFKPVKSCYYWKPRKY